MEPTPNVRHGCGLFTQRGMPLSSKRMVIAGLFSVRKGGANQAENELKGFVPRGALLDRPPPSDPKPLQEGRLS